MSQNNDVSKKVQKRSLQWAISALKNEKNSDKVRNHLRNIDNLLESYGDYFQQLNRVLTSGSMDEIFGMENSPFRQVRHRIEYVLKEIQYDRYDLRKEHLDLIKMVISEIELYMEEYL